jgi:hypothetical protein
MHIHNKICGFYKLEIGKIVEGKKIITKSTEFFPNLITNYGLDRCATNTDYLSYCHVGSGSTTPSVNDTTLVAFIASVTGTAVYSTEGSPNYYTKVIKTYSFSIGAAAGNISELGISCLSTTGGLFSRALVLDSFGDPTTITVLSDEYLNVVYELRFYPKLTDDTGTVVFTGNIGGSYNWIFRCANVGTHSSYNDGWALLNANGYTSPMNNTYYNYAYTSTLDITTITSSNPATDAVSFTSGSYTNGTYSINFTLYASPTQTNKNIRSISFKMGPGKYQIQFDPYIPKTNVQSITLIIQCSFGRV